MFKTNILKKLAIASSMLATGQMGFSAPSAYVSKWGSLFITNDTNSTLLRDTEKSQTVWVLPPSAGKASFTNFQPSANMGFCTGLKSLIKSSNILSARVEDLLKQLPEFEKEVETARKDYYDGEKKVAELGEKPSMKRILLLESSLEEMSDRQMDLLGQLDTCEDDSCTRILELYNTLKDEIKVAKTDLRELKRDNRELARKYSKAKQNADILKIIYDEEAGKLSDKLQKIGQIEGQVSEMYANKGRLAGGIASVDYDSGWSQNVRQLEGRYSNYDFKMIPTSNARISASISGASDKDTYLQSLPQVLDYTINGHKFVPWGETKIADSALPDKIVGDLRMSLIGACPIGVQNFFEGTGFTPETSRTNGPIYGISSTFQYPAAFKFNVKAKFNLWKIYERIEKKGKRGGFFSSKSFAEVSEKDWGGDTFEIDWLIEDPNAGMSFDKRRKVETAIKSELMARALGIMARPADAPGFEQPSAPIPPRSGAIVLARGLNRTCGWNIYCQGGRWVLRGAASIWGSSSSSSKFRSDYNRTTVEKWSSEIAKNVPGIVVYGR